ncbi:MAG: glycine--tRNA ligase [Methanosarcinaceae archaeon]|nr:glycine--tRNA ligase [Methanosarcinaceae archaeon]
MDIYDKIIDLAKRRGFLWNSFELYGGAAGFFDYGPNGCSVKRNIENTWRDYYIRKEGYFEIEAPTVGIEDVYIASGHVGGFSDPLCECVECHSDFRADHLLEAAGFENAGAFSLKEIDEKIEKNNIVCSECGGKLGTAYDFNLMFKTKIGPGGGRQGYMRPETAQGMFIDFDRLLIHNRDKLPFGACQIGKSYRNEISPRQGVLRLREFTQAECEIFVDPEEKTHPEFSKYENVTLLLYPRDEQENEGNPIEMTVKEAVDSGIIAHEFLGYYVALTYDFLTEIGIDKSKLRFRQHLRDEMAHYAVDCWDAEILTERFGWVEAVGIADRTDYDLKAHSAQSKTELSVYVEFPEPVFEKRFTVRPDMAKLGPLFKGKAKQIGDLLKYMSESELLEYENKETATYDLKIENELYKVPSNLVSFGEETIKLSGKTIVPHVIEPSYGIDRITYCVLEHAFYEETLESSETSESSEISDTSEKSEKESEEDETRTVLRLKNKIAPFSVAVLPLIGKPELLKISKQIFESLVDSGLNVYYDDTGTIGKRYRRNDEIGIPYSVTIDFETIDENTVTIRDRDSMKQIRAGAQTLPEKIKEMIKTEYKIE